MTECHIGLTVPQIQAMTEGRAAEFDVWMRGQTYAICTGELYNHETRQYEPDCPEPHGPVFYRHDLERFLLGGPIID